jgi:hypothetical protein
MRKRKLEQKLHDSEGSEDANLNTLNIPIGEEEALGPTLPEHHHHISKDIRHKVNVHKWLADNRKDPALKVSNTLSSLSRMKLMGDIRIFFLISKITSLAAYYSILRRM